MGAGASCHASDVLPVFYNEWALKAEAKKSAGELQSWSEGLGADGDKAAQKMQAVQRGKQARAEVVKLKRSIEVLTWGPEKILVEPPEGEEWPAEGVTVGALLARIKEQMPAAKKGNGVLLQAAAGWGEWCFPSASPLAPEAVVDRTGAGGVYVFLPTAEGPLQFSGDAPPAIPGGSLVPGAAAECFYKPYVKGKSGFTICIQELMEGRVAAVHGPGRTLVCHWGVRVGRAKPSEEEPWAPRAPKEVAPFAVQGGQTILPTSPTALTVASEAEKHPEAKALLEAARAAAAPEEELRKAALEQAKALLASDLPFFSKDLPFLTPGDTFEVRRRKQLKQLGQDLLLEKEPKGYAWDSKAAAPLLVGRLLGLPPGDPGLETQGAQELLPLAEAAAEEMLGPLRAFWRPPGTSAAQIIDYRAKEWECVQTRVAQAGTGEILRVRKTKDQDDKVKMELWRGSFRHLGGALLEVTWQFRALKKGREDWEEWKLIGWERKPMHSDLKTYDAKPAEKGNLVCEMMATPSFWQEQGWKEGLDFALGASAYPRVSPEKGSSLGWDEE